MSDENKTVDSDIQQPNENIDENKIEDSNKQQPIEDRQNLIDTAVRFLKNPKVAQTAESAKHQFLAKKGLTESEIDASLKISAKFTQSNPIGPETTNKLENQHKTGKSQLITVSNKDSLVTIKTSLLSIVLNWVKNFLVAGCVAFTAYTFIVKKYVLKSKTKKAKEIENKEAIERLENSNQQLIDSIHEIKYSLNDLKESINAMSKVVLDTSGKSLFETEDNSIRTEIQTIKNLLLNRSQFPNLPTVAPILPSWQLESKNSIKKVDKKVEINDEEANLRED